jgi:hypothetical protein
LEQKLYGHLKNITAGHSQMQYLNAGNEELTRISYIRLMTLSINNDFCGTN